MTTHHPVTCSSAPWARLLAVSLAGAAFAFSAFAAGRTETSLNAGWNFHYGETPLAEAPGFDDAAWAPVTVPHTWNAQDGQDGTKNRAGLTPGLKGDYAQGTGWYRRILHADPAWAGRQVYLQFDGANRRTDVFLNGLLVGTHLGGHARFRLDLTAALKPGVDNLLAVRVNNEGNGIIPHSADFTFFGGIYRGVSLLVTDAVQVETMDYASPGVYLKQVAVSPEKAEVQALVKLANHEAAPAELGVRLLLTDAAGRTVLERTGTTSVPAHGQGEVTLPVLLASPHLWNGRTDPYLYRVKVEVSAGGAVRDDVEQPLGLRFFRVDPAQGFFLNGRYLDLHGASRHQDRLDQGWAISAADDREDFALMLEMGCTVNRVAHYQQSPLWYQLADEQGMVQWAEIPFVDEALPTATFFNNALDQMRELIRQNYNHPGICFWGCGNENFDEGQGFAEGIARYGPMAERLIQALHALVHAEDPTRLTTYASFHSENDVNLVLPGQKPVSYQGEPQRWYTDVTAFNKYFGWYYGEPSDNAGFFDGLHARHPAQCLGVSEYGAGGSINQHEPDHYADPARPRTPMDSIRRRAFAREHPEEYQAWYHEETWKVLKARPYIWGKFIWNMFDFAVDWRDEGDHAGRNDKGLVTFDRKTRKDAFYFYQAHWSPAPMLHLTGRRYVQRTEPVVEVKAYTNAPEAELFVNGRSLGKMAADDNHIVRWPGVTLQPGENRLRTTATVAGHALADECAWNFSPALPPPAAAPKP